MTAPDGQTPDGALVVSNVNDLAQWSEERIMERIRGELEPTHSDLAESLHEVIGGVGDLIRGIVKPGFERHEPVADAMLSLLNRTDLLYGVQGWGAAYMSRNVRLDWDFFQSNWRTMPFDAQTGPAHNVTVQEDGRLRLDGKGAWVVIATTTAASTSFSGSGQVRMDVNVYDANDNLIGTRVTEATSAISVDWAGQVTNKGNATLVRVFLLVVEDPGATLEVRTWTAAWRKWQGGTDYSLLGAFRLSENAENPGQGTVRDETEEEAEEDTP